MKLLKYLLGFIVILLLATTIFISLRSINMRSTKTLPDFSEFIRNGNLNDLSLTIYYLSPNFLTRAPVREADLINGWFEYKVTIHGIRLEKHIGLLNQIINAALIPVEHASSVDARLYYVFETKTNGKIFSVSMWGDDNSIFVNGLEVKENDVFYDVVMPFLPEDAVKELKVYLQK